MLRRQLFRITRGAGSGCICRKNYRSNQLLVTLKYHSFDPNLLINLFGTTSFRSVGYKLQDNLRDCYSFLNVKDGCSQEELKEAYIRSAKLYHPDSQSKTADAKKFNQVKEAYRAIKRKIQSEELLEVTDDEDDDYETLLKWRAPQHRQFLSHEGVGSGTMSERQKQYGQMRVTQATNRIYKYKLKKLMPEGENAMVAKDKRAARTRKIRNRYIEDDQWLKGETNKDNTIDRMVEDMILESMSKGSFDNLSGFGKPHKFSDKDKNPYVDKITAKLNQILIEDDMKPEWISMQKELRGDLRQAREKLAIHRRLLGDPPYSEDQLNKWESHKDHFKASVNDINSRIDNYNLIVPILNKQMVHYNSDKEIDNICSDCDKFIPSNYDFSQHIPGYHEHVSAMKEPLWNWKDIWKNIKGAF